MQQGSETFSSWESEITEPRGSKRSSCHSLSVLPLPPSAFVENAPATPIFYRVHVQISLSPSKGHFVHYHASLFDSSRTWESPLTSAECLVLTSLGNPFTVQKQKTLPIAAHSFLQLNRPHFLGCYSRLYCGFFPSHNLMIIISIHSVYCCE